MWVRRAAIRPVPTYARVPHGIVEGLTELFDADTDDATRERLDDVFTDFEERQPALAAYVAEVLGKSLDDTALALGYFLMTATWLAFDTSHSEALEEVSDDLLNATRESLALDEQLRISDPAEPLDSDDVVAMEQPHLLEFINDHVSGTLEAHQDEIEVDDVYTVYRMTLIAVLALSYAVKAPRGFPLAKTELMA